MAENKEFKITIRAVTDQFESAMRRTKDSFREANQSFRQGMQESNGFLNDMANNLGKSMGVLLNPVTLATAGIAALGAGAVAAGVKGMQMAMEFEDAGNKLQASLGLATEETEEFKARMEESFADARGTVQEIQEAYRMVASTMQTGAEETGRLADKALVLQEAFGLDVTSSIKAVDTMTKNLGIDGDKAFDIIATTAQKAGDKADDLLDTFWEYSNQFAEMGLDAEQFAGILTTASEEGVYNFDKVADAVKEFNIRIKDGSKTTVESMQMLLGDGATEVFNKMKSGAMTGAEAMQLVLTELQKIDDPLKREQIAVGLFGTQWEDVGDKAMLAMTKGMEGLEGFEGAMDKATDAVDDSFSKQIERIGNQFSLLAKDVAEQLLPYLKQFADFIEDNMPKIQRTVETAIDVVKFVFTDLAVVLKNAWEIFKLGYTIVKETVGLIVDVLTGDFEGAKQRVINIFEAIKTAISDIFDNILGAVKTKFNIIKEHITDKGKDIVNGLWEGLQEKTEWLKGKVTEWIKAVLPGPIEKALGIASPSKVMKVIGQQSAEGLALGVVDGKSKVQQAVTQLAVVMGESVKTMTDKYNKTLYQMELQFSKERMKLRVEEMQKEIERTQTEVQESEKRIEQLKKELKEYKKGSEDYEKISEDIRRETENLAKVQERAAKARANAEQQAKSLVISALQQQRNILEDVQDVWERHHQALAEAKEEYQRRVREVNRQLAEDERRLTEDLKRQIEQRAQDLMNWTGLFDVVSFSGEGITGGELLGNLRDQVNAFDEWQEQIGLLAQKGVDEGLIKELQKMGPKALPQIKALNKLSDEELTEYVNLYRMKAQQAREEAMRQLEQQRRETQMKLMEIRANAYRQLEMYRQKWAEKQKEIRKNTMEELDAIERRYKQMAENSTHYGVSLMENFIGGVRSRFGVLRSTLEQMMEMVDMYMPHSPAKVGPLKKLDEYGPAMVQEIARGIQGSLPTLERAVNQMAQVPSMAVVGGGGGGSTTNNSHTTNYFNISIESGNAEEVWEKLQDELHRRGFDL